MKVELIDEARAFCEKHNLSEGINQIGFSGGKDSTALYLLALEILGSDFTPVLADTDNEHPTTMEYVRTFHEKLPGGPEVVIVKAVPYTEEQWETRRDNVRKRWGEPHKIRAGKRMGEFLPPMPDDLMNEAVANLHPTGNQFLDMCLMHGMFPIRRSQFCTQEMKLIPVYNQVLKPMLDTGLDVYSWNGVRRDESVSRKDALMFEEDRRDPEGFLTSYRPLINWTAEDVFAMHKRHGIEPNPLYKQGMSRVGCMPCIHCGKSTIRQMAERFPEVFDRIEQWEAIMKKVNRWCLHENINPSFLGAGLSVKAIKKGGVRQVIEWSKTSRSGTYDLVNAAEDYEACSSMYGLCE